MTLFPAAALQAAGRVGPLRVLVLCLLSLLWLEPTNLSIAPDARSWSQSGPRLQLSHSGRCLKAPSLRVMSPFVVGTVGGGFTEHWICLLLLLSAQ